MTETPLIIETGLRAAALFAACWLIGALARELVHELCRWLSWRAHVAREIDRITNPFFRLPPIPWRS